MEDLLYLVHRIPYPPNKGDKIRSYNFLRILTEKFRVHLGAFVDDPEDMAHSVELEALCKSVKLIPIHPPQRKILSLKGFLFNQALGLQYYRHPDMQRWVDEILNHYGIHKVMIFSSTMAQYVIDNRSVGCFTDFVDIDSDKWLQYAKNKSWPASFIYGREGRLLLQYERYVASRSRAALFVSEQECQLFKQLAPETKEKIDFVNNGVDTDYFSPGQSGENPYEKGGPTVVFTGAMDYWANVDAVIWFAKEVFPAVKNNIPNVRFFIVGGKPAKSVLELANDANITVTGRVEDIRPYLAGANLVVAPLRVARGIQNKVLEAFAMARPVVATTAAMEGIDYSSDVNVEIVDDAVAFAKTVTDFLGVDAPTMSASQNRQFVIQKFSWEASKEKLIWLLTNQCQ